MQNPANAKIPTAEALPPRLHGRARAEQRKLEAEARAKTAPAAPAKANGGTTVTAPATAPAKSVGSIVERDGVRHLLCPGQHGNCRLLVPVSEARVGSLGAIKRRLGINRYDEINEDNIATIAFCTQCADKILAGGHQSIAEAITSRDERIAEYEADRAKAAKVAAEYRDKAAERSKRKLDGKFRPSPAAVERARLAASGGAKGDPANPIPEGQNRHKAHKAVLAKKSEKAMHKGPSGGGNQNNGKGKKGKKK